MWYAIKNSECISSPSLIFYKDRIRENIQAMVEIAGTPDRLRPHIKTHKCAEIISMQLEAGIRKYKCATIAEAEMLAIAGVKDILIAYPLVGPGITRFIDLRNTYPDAQFSCLIDNPIALQALARASEDAGMLSRVYIDVDCGMHRTGCSPEVVKDLVTSATQLNGVVIVGLHAYDGHLHDHSLEERTIKANAVYKIVAALGQNSGLEIVIGGSPTFPIHAQHPELTLSPGTTVLWDKGYGNAMEGLEMFKPAALILSRVISQPEENRYCLDAGHKAISAEHRQPPEILTISEFELATHSEEHMVIVTNETLEIGQEMLLIPHHICPTVALHDEAIIVENNQVIDHWPISARGRKITV